MMPKTVTAEIAADNIMLFSLSAFLLSFILAADLLHLLFLKSLISSTEYLFSSNLCCALILLLNLTTHVKNLNKVFDHLNGLEAMI